MLSGGLRGQVVRPCGPLYVSRNSFSAQQSAHLLGLTEGFGQAQEMPQRVMRLTSHCEQRIVIVMHLKSHSLLLIKTFVISVARTKIRGNYIR